MDTVPDAAEIRAQLARRRLPLYLLAAQIRIHPVRLGRMLNERIPLSAAVAERIARALAVRDQLEADDARKEPV